MSHVKVLPSYPAPDREHLLAALDTLAGTAAEFQVDIVDGQFVPATSWPFIEGGRESFAVLQPYAEKYVLEVDCMVKEPQQYLDEIITAGVQRIVIHQHSTEDYEVCLAHAKAHGYQIGIAVLPTVQFNEVAELIAQFDYVQVMGIREVGKQGQSFAPETIELVKTIRATFPEKSITIDGSVNFFTIPILVEAGADRLAPGSAIINAEDQTAAYRELESLANQQAI